MIKDKLKQYQKNTALIVNNIKFSYEELLSKYEYLGNFLSNNSIKSGSIIVIDGILTVDYIALFLLLIDYKCMVVPFSITTANKENLMRISEANVLIYVYENHIEIKNLCFQTSNNLFKNIIGQNHSGLIIFTSGTTGEPKAILHDMDVLLSKYVVLRQNPSIILSFLKADHIGGINTILYCIFSGATMVMPNSYSPSHICELIDKYKINILPATPSFINLFLLTGAYQNYDLSSITVISYGTEVMPSYLLMKLSSIFHNVKIKQTYGLSELGILSTKSYSNSSLLIRVGGDGYETKIVNNILYIRSKYSMIGYLNAPNPFDEDGWFNTQDIVEEFDEGYIKLLGRKSEIINIGGNKVFASYIENILIGMDEIEDVVIEEVKHTVLGNYIVAKVKLKKPETKEIDFKRNFYKYCSDNLEKFQIPAKIEITNSVLFSDRFKKKRGG